MTQQSKGSIKMSDLKHKLIVGLEIHVQLCTATKMFCGCALAFGEEAKDSKVVTKCDHMRKLNV
jgi:Asp-tRNA(Asn)/Glu-tRNA(Gln) amidotransferase B subunit